jgi:putative transposase
MDQLAGLTEESRKLALDRFRVLQPHLEDACPLKAVAAAAGIPFRTAQRWAALYQQFGLAGLARKKRSDGGQHREISAKLKEVIEGIALQKPPLPVAAICRQVRRLAQDLGEEPPSYWVVYRIVTALPADLVTLAHEGTKAYSNTFELVHRREADKPNAVWQADHTPLDIMLIRPDGAAAKPWLTTVIDDYSRAVAGYLLRLKIRPHCTLPWRYVKRYGARKIRAGSRAASPTFSTPTMGATSPPNIWNR